MDKLLLLLRVSKPEHNKSLYQDHILYMNPQLSFNKETLLPGQYDATESTLTNTPVYLYYSTDGKKTWNYIAEAKSVRKDNNAYIHCMYAITFSEGVYDKTQNTFHYRVPWEYIKDVWKPGHELMIIKNTPLFISCFEEAAEGKKFPYHSGLVKYDLEEKHNSNDYFSDASTSPFLTVFHKKSNPYSVQKEYRFAIINSNRPDHYELKLRNDVDFKISILPLQHGKDVHFVLSDLEFDSSGFPTRFSSELLYCENDSLCV